MDTKKTIKKHLDIRFGVVAIQKGLTNKFQVLKALEIQLDEDLSIGYHRPIGQILIDGGLITPAQCDEVLQSLSKVSENSDT
jgi:hypothetical protein